MKRGRVDGCGSMHKRVCALLGAHSTSCSAQSNFSAVSGQQQEQQEQQELRIQQQEWQHQHHTMLLNTGKPAMLKQLLEQILGEADAGLNLTTQAVVLATRACTFNSHRTAEAGLAVAEHALAATMQLLAVARALAAQRAQKLQQQLRPAAELPIDGIAAAAAAEEVQEDESLQDTCTSRYVEAPMPQNTT